MWVWWSWLLVMLCVLPRLSDARSFPHTPDALRDTQVRWGTATGGYTVADCWHEPSATTTVTVAACRAYALGEEALQGFEEPTPRTLTYSAGDGAYWVVGRSTPAVTPAGWTCAPGTHYCWQRASVQPERPDATTWLLHVTVAGGAVTAVEDISHRVFTTTPALSASRTIGATGVWTFAAGARLTLAAGVTLTVKGCLEAGVQQIFTGPGLVQYQGPGSCRTVRPEWWGAQGDGVTPGQDAFFQAASTALAATGGVVRAAGPSAHYQFGANWEITASNLTFEGEGALFSSASGVRFLVSPPLTRANAGDWSIALHNVHLRHWRVGTDNTAANLMLGAQLRWCESCSVEHVIKKGATTTAFNMYNCRHCRFAHLHIEGNNGGAFHILAHFAFESVIDDVYVTQGDGAARGPARVLQMKGGQNNRIRHVSVVNIPDPLAEIAFYNRGDDPDAPSASSPDLQVYPWPTNGALDCRVDNCYSLPDGRRANHSNLYDSLTVQDAPYMTAFNDQESVGTMWTNLVADNVRAGMVMLKTNTPGAVEKNFTLQTFRFTSIGTTTGLGTSGIGVQVRGADLLVPPELLEGVRIANGLIANATAEAVLVTYTTDIVLTELRVLGVGVGLPPGTVAGIRVGQNALRPVVTNNYVEDTAATPVLTHGVFITPNAYRPAVAGNRVVCPSCNRATFFYLNTWVAGSYGGNDPALCTARTTDGVATDTRCRVRVDPDTTTSIIAACTARAGSERAYYLRHYLVRDVAGTAATETAPAQDVTIESMPGWEVDYVNAVGFWYLRLLGAAGTTVDWLCDLRTTLID